MTRLLITDDDADMRMLAGMVARDAGWQVIVEAVDAEEALDVLDDVAPDVVLMDFHLPGMDGVAATRQIKAARPDTTVVAWTSADERIVAERFVAAGADMHLLKADLGHLRDVLRKLVRTPPRRARAAPLVVCTQCEFSWYSPAMAHGLSMLGHCPRCDGPLQFTGPRDCADRTPARGGARPPHLVLGLPRGRQR